MGEIMTISNVRGYFKDDVAYLNAEDVARGFGFIQEKNGIEYVRWETLNNYLRGFNFSQQVGKDDYIPENMVYRLGFKASNETAQAFQAKLADEIIPSIRRNGGYISNQEHLTPEQIVANALIVAQNIIADRDKQIEAMKPKADYFDALVDRNLNTNIRDTAKELGIAQNQFVMFLMDNGYIYRDLKGKIKPYAEKNKGLFVLKEYCSPYNSTHAGLQTLITPKGRETFRLLLMGE